MRSGGQGSAEFYFVSTPSGGSSPFRDLWFPRSNGGFMKTFTPVKEPHTDDMRQLVDDVVGIENVHRGWIGWDLASDAR